MSINHLYSISRIRLIKHQVHAIVRLLLLLFIFFCCKEKFNNKKKFVHKKVDHFADAKTISDTILLVSMDFEEGYLIPRVISKIQAFYKLSVKHIQAPLPRFAYYRERNRYKADSILNYLAVLNSKHYRFVAGLTSKDISTTNGSISNWGVFGLGSLSAKGCITSSFRLKTNASPHKLLERIQKVILHEIGHNYSLNHCTSSYPCFMKAAGGKIATVDNEPMDMCIDCRTKINL